MLTNSKYDLSSDEQSKRVINALSSIEKLTSSQLLAISDQATQLKLSDQYLHMISNELKRRRSGQRLCPQCGGEGGIDTGCPTCGGSGWC